MSQVFIKCRGDELIKVQGSFTRQISQCNFAMRFCNLQVFLLKMQPTPTLYYDAFSEAHVS
jgi:hypothetical protein